MNDIVAGDLISRQALIDDIEELKQSPWFNDENYFAIRKDGVNCVVDLCIKKAPSVDAVEVVRCGECKHMSPVGVCTYFADSSVRPSASDFCSYGERKTDG